MGCSAAAGAYEIWACVIAAGDDDAVRAAERRPVDLLDPDIRLLGLTPLQNAP
jgi:hypothetical protein